MTSIAFKRNYFGENSESQMKKLQFCCPRITVQNYFVEYPQTTNCHINSCRSEILQKKMISKVDKSCIKLHGLLFFYMPPFPITWDPSFSKVQPTDVSDRQLAPWILSIIYIFLMGVLCLFSVIIYGWLCPTPDFHTFKILLNAAVSIFCFVGSFCAYLLVPNYKRLLSVYNEILTLECVLIKIYSSKPTAPELAIQKPQSASKAALIIITLLTPAMPFLASVYILVTNIDIGYTFLEQYILPDPIYRNQAEVYIAAVFRVLILVPMFFEGVRTVSCVLIFIFIGLDSVANIMYFFQYKVGRLVVNKNIYVLLTLFERIFEKPLYILVYVTLTVAFWLFVTCFWILVKGAWIANNMTLCAAALSLIVLLIFVCYLLPIYCNEFILLQHLLDFKRQKARHEWILTKSRQAKVLWKQLHALKPVKVRYGPFFFIEVGFVNDYINLLVQRTFDVVMLLEFNVL